MSEDITTNLGTILRQIRQKRKLTIKEVATKAKMNPGYLSRVERNISLPGMKKFAAICRVFNVSPWRVIKASEVTATTLDPLIEKIFEILGIQVNKDSEE